MNMQSTQTVRLFHLFSILLLLNFHCFAQIKNGENHAPVTIPDTAAGKQFARWLAVFNSGERETVRRFIDENFDKPPNGNLPVDALADHDIITFRETGGYTVRKIGASSPAVIAVVVQSKLTGYWMQIQLYIKAEPPNYEPTPPYKIAGIGFSNLEAPTELLPKIKLSRQEISLKTDELMTKLVNADRFSGVLLVAKDGKPFYQKAFGTANRAWRIPNRLNTRFNLASMTKMFTAVAVAQLAEKGRLDLDDTVGKILPDYPNQEVARRVTIRQLLTHISGLAGADRTADRLLATLQKGARTVNEHLAAFVNDPPAFDPGSRFEYSNYGYILLGAIIEKASGEDYYSYVKKHIFEPAGMIDTDFYELDSDPPNLADGLMDAPEGLRRSNRLMIGVKGMPASGAYSTVGDLLKFDVTLRNHRLISAKMTDQLWIGSTQNSRYGGGFEISKYNKTRIIGHAGGWFGITNRMEIYPETGYTVIILSNYDSDPTGIANKLREWITQNPNNEIPVAPSFALTISVQPETAAPGTPLKITLTVKNSGGEADGNIVNMEIKNANAEKVEQQFSTGQSFKMGESKTYTFSWTPDKSGSYRIDAGVFGDNWATKHIYNEGAATINVN